MTLKDIRGEIEIELDKLVVKLDVEITRLEPSLDTESKCYQTEDENRFNSVSYFFINGAFASLVELRRNLVSRSIVSSLLITRYLLELHSDFKLIFEDEENSKKYANAFWYFGEMRRIELIKKSTETEKSESMTKWKKYRITKDKNMHWSGLSRTSVIRRTWEEDSEVYDALSAFGHFSLLTQDFIFWNYTDNALSYTSANVDVSIGMVDEIFKIAQDKKLCGVKI